MKTIWKYELVTTDEQRIEMPSGANVLCVQTQREIPCLWAEVDPNAKRDFRTFRIFGTGHALDVGAEARYVGSYQPRHGSLVFHVYEITS